MDMYVKLNVHMSNMDKWKRPSRNINPKGNLIPIRPSIASVINTDFLYTDVYKRVDINRNTWNISIFNTGTGTIGGTLTENNIPISNCMLYLYQSSTGVLAKRTISKEDGSFMFTGIVADVTYFVVGVHKAKKFNSVILDEVRIDSLGKDI